MLMMMMMIRYKMNKRMIDMVLMAMTMMNTVFFEL